MDLSSIINLRAGDEFFEGQKDIADHAISYFRLAQNMDSSYLPTRINKAVAYILHATEASYNTAQSILNQAMPYTTTQSDKEKIELVGHILLYKKRQQNRLDKRLNRISPKRI